MYKNIEVLDKQKHKDLKFDDILDIEVAKNIGIVPIGVDEILDISSIAPIIINGGENSEFVAFTGLSNVVNIYNNESLYIPKFVKSYPFFNIVVKDENNNLNTLVAIDNNENYVGKDKKNSILAKDKELEEIASKKIALVRELNRQRDISKKVVQELKDKNLLLKKDFRIGIEDKEKIILEEFYIVNRDELLKQDDATLATWAKKGWMGIIDAHVKSLANFQKLLESK